MEKPTEGLGIIAKAGRFAELSYDEETLERVEKEVVSLKRAGSGYAVIAAAYLRDAVRMRMIDAAYVREVFGEEIEKHTRV